MKSRVLLAFFIATAAMSAAQENWPRFRGPGGSGVSETSKPPVEFGPDKNVLWNVAVPPGASSPCIWQDRIFLTAFDGGKLWTLCLDRVTGQELWRRDAKAEKIEPFMADQGSPAASTPATDGERVVAYFGSCGLIAYDFSGTELWRHLLPTAETNNDFGSGTSAIIEDGLVILLRDLKSNSAVMALDAKTGKLAWSTDRPGMATGWSTPIVWKHDGMKEVVASGGLLMKSYDLTSGSERWAMRELSTVNCTSPVAGDGLLYYAGWSPAGEDAPMPAWDDLLKADTDHDGKISRAESDNTPMKGFFDPNDTNHDGFLTRDEWEALVSFLKKGKNRMIAVKPGGAGDITETNVAWEKKKGLPYVPSPLLYRGRLYFIKDGGLLSCYDAVSGAPKCEQERVGISSQFYASPVAADGHIYLCGLNGKVATLSAGDKPEVIWHAEFGERIAATPAFAGDMLIVRTATKLFAFAKGN